MNSYKKFIKIFIISILFSFSISNIRKRNLITLFIISFSKFIIFSVRIFSSRLVLKFNREIKNSKAFSNFILNIKNLSQSIRFSGLCKYLTISKKSVDNRPKIKSKLFKKSLIKSKCLIKYVPF